MADLFSEPNVKSDIVLIVEDKRMYVSKTILSLASPVFEDMFESDLKEIHDTEIPLPGKKYDDFLEFLLCFYPHSMKPVTFDNVDTVLPLADEFQVEYIKRKSEETLLRSVEEMALSDKELVHILLMADKYGLSKARAVAINNVVMCTHETLAKDDGFAVLRATLKVDILLEQNSKLLKEINSLQTEIATLHKMPLVECKIFHHVGECRKCRTCASCVGEMLRTRTGAFGTNASTSSVGLFGQSPTAQTGGLFDASKPLFGNTATSTGTDVGFGTSTNQTSSLCGQSQTGLFANKPVVFGDITTTSSPDFGFATASHLFAKSMSSASTFGFGTASSTPAFGTAQSVSLFGAKLTRFGTTSTSLSAGDGTFNLTSSGTGLFGSPAGKPCGFAFAPGFGIATSAAATGGLFSQTPTRATVFGQSRPGV
ncbi:uncharacterized protein LOC121373880 isoform X2 [Gigantopelta aegis]|uniref:uncharacterized protein LOC121373880 isoform X2 n=1 Tax=Gigantopelta aegis TaxID=1735272 RepID=UPI001B889436|nr:uncharacterized protein LOC121373880 isoform X2 [Gigantopelta aegis]